MTRTETRAPFFNMKAVVRETGLNPMTIRTWERRYGLPQPRRSDGGHRQYTQRDIDLLRWLVARQREGLSMRHAVESWRALEAEDPDPLSQDEQKPEIGIMAAGDVSVSQLDELRAQWLDAVLSFNHAKADQLLTQAFSLFPAEIVCTEVLQRGIVHLGSGWQDGDVTVQQEHFATELAVRRLESLVAGTPRPLRPERILICCAPDEQHVFVPLLLTFLLLRRGWDVIYLGANVPAEAMAQTLDQVKPALVVLSAQRFHTAAGLKQVADLVFGNGVTVGFGGAVFNRLPALRSRIPGHFLGESLEEALYAVETLLALGNAESPPAVAGKTNKAALDSFRAARARIEFDVWQHFITTSRPTDDLAHFHVEMAQAIEAALKLGDIALLGTDISLVEHLLISYHPTSASVADYVTAYSCAAQTQLGQEGAPVIAWLGSLLPDPIPAGT